MNNHRIVYMGTPAFSAYILEKLIEAKYNIVGVVSQPDREVGRKRILTPTPVKEVALRHNIDVYQPVSLRKDYEFLKNMGKPYLMDHSNLSHDTCMEYYDCSSWTIHCLAHAGIKVIPNTRSTGNLYKSL